MADQLGALVVILGYLQPIWAWLQMVFSSKPRRQRRQALRRETIALTAGVGSLRITRRITRRVTRDYR